MFECKGYFDYCIQLSCIQKDYENTIKALYNYGYRTIAINQVVDEGDVEPKKKKKKGETCPNFDCVPEPFPIKPVEGTEGMKILNRLTIVFSNQDVLHKITKSPFYKKYHIIASLPTTLAAFTFTCSNFEADILVINPEYKKSLKFGRKMYNHLIERGYYLEIFYSPTIEDTTLRRNIIHLAHFYHAIGKSRNVIVSSGASKPSLIRSPYDVINLGLIFGLSEAQAKNAVMHCGRKVYINSVGRRHGKAVMFAENVIKPEDSIIEIPEESVIELSDSEGEEGEIVEPYTKRVKQ